MVDVWDILFLNLHTNSQIGLQIHKNSNGIGFLKDKLEVDVANNNKKSAKDIAFEKERTKFRQQIRELESDNKKKMLEIIELQEALDKKDEEIKQKEDWITRLLEYTELSEDDMKKIIDKDKAVSEFANHMNSMSRIFGKFMY